VSHDFGTDVDYGFKLGVVAPERVGLFSYSKMFYLMTNKYTFVAYRRKGVESNRTGCHKVSRNVVPCLELAIHGSKTLGRTSVHD
jgi:hypothetical protein